MVWVNEKLIILNRVTVYKHNTPPKKLITFNSES